MKRWSVKSFLAGMVVMAIIMGSNGFAQSITKTIEVSLDTVKKIVINGADVTPLQDKQPFVYNGTTYVPLRYISESFYKNVEWDGVTGTIRIDGIKISEEEKDAIYKTIDLNYQHMAEKDIKGVLDDLSAKVSEYARNSTQQAVQYMFDNYVLDFKLIDREILSYDGNTCEIRVVTEVRKLEGELYYTDNRNTSIHKLIKEDGKWKFLYSVIEKLEMLPL
ncbi:stalk domain-containing protein [Petroclostridium xylanilyticum]|jgi:hypothetical protein|uniref:stalk domain-containing protein n=1 Tax=Petroclostridium xylanilyticum TaxID=1792311 RepID=UPI000B99A9BF|nr:stalk domain-containing protein [Petroclostridium xylanilyticum]